MTTAKLSDVKLVLSAPVRFSSRRKAIQAAQVACVRAQHDFESRATPATWDRLVVSSRQLHALVNDERAKALGVPVGERLE